jgi:hypothetical protein
MHRDFFFEKEGTVLLNQIGTVHPNPITEKSLKNLKITDATSRVFSPSP